MLCWSQFVYYYLEIFIHVPARDGANIADIKRNTAVSQVRTLFCKQSQIEQIQQTNLDRHLCSVGAAGFGLPVQVPEACLAGESIDSPGLHLSEAAIAPADRRRDQQCATVGIPAETTSNSCIAESPNSRSNCSPFSKNKGDKHFSLRGSYSYLNSE